MTSDYAYVLCSYSLNVACLHSVCSNRPLLLDRPNAVMRSNKYSDKNNDKKSTVRKISII